MMTEWRGGVPLDELSFDSVLDEWERDSRAHCTDKTLRRYRISRVQLDMHFAGTPWRKLDTRAVIDFVKWRKSGGACGATIKRDLTVLSQATELAIMNGWSERNFVHDVPRLALRHRTPTFVQPPSWCVEAIIARCVGNFRSLARFALATGVRLDEAVYMQVEDIDWRRSCATLPRTKNHSVRTVALSSEALDVVREQLPLAENGWLFPTSRGGPYSSPSNPWQVASKRARVLNPVGFVHCSFHALRHLYAINYLATGRGSIYELQRQLGHGSIKMTERYLDHVTSAEGLHAQYGNVQ